jgi:hypothetical protein
VTRCAHVSHEHDPKIFSADVEPRFAQTFSSNVTSGFTICQPYFVQHALPISTHRKPRPSDCQAEGPDFKTRQGERLF